MKIPNTKQDLVRMIEAGRSNWFEVVSGLSDEQCLRPNTCGFWSVKDIIAHISWYEQQMEWMVTRHSMEGDETALWVNPTDERNAKIYKLYHDLSLDEVKNMEQARYGRMLAAMEQLEDIDIIDYSRYEGMPSDWVPADIIAQNTWQHYADHLPAIKKEFGL